MWIDTNCCELNFHVIKRQDGEWVVVHIDGTKCELVEFDVSDLVEG